MKARLPLNRKHKDRIRQEVAVEYDRQGREMTRRIFKLFCLALNKQYGFGHDRLCKVMNLVSQMSAESTVDEAFWTHVDRAVVDQLNMGDYFEKENYNVMDK